MKYLIASTYFLIIGTTAWSAANPPPEPLRELPVIDFGTYIKDDITGKWQRIDGMNIDCDRLTRHGTTDYEKWKRHCDKGGV